jgi:calmodulin
LGDFKEAFALFDKNNDGKITIDNLDTVMKALGQTFSKEELQVLFNVVDIDGNGYVDLPEFMTMLMKEGDNLRCDEKDGKTQQEKDEDELKEMFALFDVNKDGLITVQELMRMFAKLDLYITTEEAGRMILDGDIDGDGKLNYYEFKSLITAIESVDNP